MSSDSSSFVRSALTMGLGVGLGASICYMAMRGAAAQTDSKPSVASQAPRSVAHPPIASTPSTSKPSRNVTVADHFMEDDILKEHFTRNIQFFGEEAQKKIANSFVVVVGLGGVGSHAAHMLLRSGVGKLRIVDFDQVTLSSLNRHAVATRADVGLPKATCLERHFAGIVPECHVEALVSMYTKETEELILGGHPDFVLDAIDNIDTKIDLLVACKKRGIPVLCSAGAGARADPTRIRIADISESNMDNLGRKVRSMLRLKHGVESGIPLLFSLESPRMGLVSVAGPDANPEDYQVIPGFRVRTIPVLGTMPAIFGMAAASYILTFLADWGLVTESVVRLHDKQFEQQYNWLLSREEERFGSLDGFNVSLDDVIYLVRELYRGQSARAVQGNITKGMNRITSGLKLTRWDKNKPSRVDNLVLLTTEEAEAHDAMTLGEVWRSDPALVRRVEVLQRHARRDHGLPMDGGY